MNYEIPTLVYTASGVNRIYENENWKREFHIKFTSYQHLRVAEGIKLNLVLGVAATIEGLTKFYLAKEIDALIFQLKEIDANPNSPKQYLSSKEIEEYIESEPLNNNTPTYHKPEPSINAKVARVLGRFPIEKFVCNYDKNKKLKFFFCWVKEIFIRFIFKISFAKKSNCNKIYRLRKIKSIIEKSTWKNLEEHFNRVNPYKLSVILSSPSDVSIYSDIRILFALRNFIIHSNLMIFNSSLDKFVPNEIKLKRIIYYYEKKGYKEEEYEGQFFIEKLVPENWIHRIVKVMNLYISNEQLNKNNNVNYLKSLIWKN